MNQQWVCPLCGALVAPVVEGENPGEHSVWLVCQGSADALGGHHTFGYPWIEKQWESGFMPEVPSALHPWEGRVA
jgi:hypothetical protein